MSLAGCGGMRDEPDLAMYQFRDTRNLVRFVHDASLILRRDGLRALDYFRGNRDKYITADYYLYIYHVDGSNMFHSGMPELEGHDLAAVADKDGRQIRKLVLDALEDKHNPHGWVHYLWWEPGKFYPAPKSSCHFKVVTPEGETVYVGGGLNYPHEEREFARIVVDGAVDFINRHGPAALAEIANPVSKYNYRDVRVFAFRRDGEALISPTASAFHGSPLLDCVDDVGYKPFESAIKKLQSSDAAWEVFMVKSHYRRELTKKVLYVRKARLEGDDVYVAAITDLPQPPY